MSKKTSNSLNTKGIQDFFSEKTVGLVSRERELKQLMYAVLTQEHMLLMGKPGTGKSQFALKALEQIENSNLFKAHITKQTTEEYVFGPLNFKEFKENGKMVHNTEDGILEADYAFLDEFFDGSDVLLRSLLGVLNERQWMKAQGVQAKLKTAVLTSNYTRENEVTEAILDRILFKTEIKPLKSKSDYIKVYKGYLNQNLSKPKKLNNKELEAVWDLMKDPKSVDFPDEVIKIYHDFVSEFQQESNKYISQRTANKALNVVKATTILDGRKEVKFSDLEEVRYVFCVLNNDKEENVFDAVYTKIVAPAEKILESIDTLQRISQEVAELPVDLDKKDVDELVEVSKVATEHRDAVENLRRELQEQKINDNKVNKMMSSLIKDIETIATKNKARIDEVVQLNQS